jgi:ribosome recycling factor
MRNKNYHYDNNDKFKQFNEDFEDFGYDVKNVRRQTKKKVTKFKRKLDEWHDGLERDLHVN